MFKHTIVKLPGKTYINGLTTSDLGKPILEKALEQHRAYIEALKTCGVEVTVLPSDDGYPDSTFVEDTAVLTPKFAVISNGRNTRFKPRTARLPYIMCFY